MEGKSLNNEPQEKTKTECTIEAIAMLSNLDRMFIKEIKAEEVKGIKLRREVERSYFTPQETFAKQCKIRKITQPFEEKAFAESEAKRLKYLLDKVFSLLAKAEYFLHTKESPDAYKKAGEYIEYLNLITEPKQNKIEETHDSFKKSPGRPAKQTYPFNHFLSCSEEDKKKVIDVMKEQFNSKGPVGIVYLYLALKNKDYFNQTDKRAEFWDASRSLLGNVCTNSNLNNHLNRKKSETEKTEIEKITKKLP